MWKSPTCPTEPVSWHPLDLEEHPIDALPKIRAVVVGAGISGINAAILLPAKVPGLDLVIYERSSDIGGVWHECIYPGVQCDVPSHVYQSTFAPSLDWSEHYAKGAEIKSYWHDVAAKYNACQYVKLNHEVLSADWNEEKAKWLIRVSHRDITTIDEADCLIMSTGIFSHPKLPSYPGLSSYEGKICHSSRWDPHLDPTGKNVAVIGNGASGLQILPQLQKVSNKIDHYVRSPTWIAGNFGPQGDDRGKPIPNDLRDSFSDPETYLQYRKGLENASFSGFDSITKDGNKSKSNREDYYEAMKLRLGDRTDLLDAIIPKFSPSCRRLTPGPGYLEAIAKPNVDYITAPIERFTKTGIKTTDGRERDVDAIICCTGSEKSFAPPFPITRGEVDLSSAWKPGGSIGYPHVYLGISAPGFPNLFFINGPNAAAPTGTLPFATENQIVVVAKILRKIRTQGIRTISPSFQATEDFRAYCEAYFPQTVLSEDCSSWFNGGVKGGRVVGSWPGSGLHANMVRRELRWEDWEYTYKSKSSNRFAYFGNGWTQMDVEANQESVEGSDKFPVDMTPYLHLDSVVGKVDLRSYHEEWFHGLSGREWEGKVKVDEHTFAAEKRKYVSLEKANGAEEEAKEEIAGSGEAKRRKIKNIVEEGRDVSVRKNGPILKGPFDFADSPLSRAARQPLLLGVFLNLQDIKYSSLPTSNSWTFDYNVKLVQKAEALGFDLAFTRAQWLPKGHYDGDASLEAFVALGAMAAVTKKIMLISTMHVLYGPLHPLHIAKYGATLDHIAKGRWGINMVTGHSAISHEMFGRQRIEHDKRYEMAGELFDVVNSLWNETENLSYEGRISPWKLENAWVTPKPLYGRPVLVNATGSPAGIDFAARYSDLIFITSPGGAHIESALETLPAHIATIRNAAKAVGRTVKTVINPMIVSRDTPEEAEAYAQSIASNAIKQPIRKGDSDAHAWRGRSDSKHKQGRGLGGNIELIGSPEQIVDQLQALHSVGIDGVQINFYDFAVDLDYFGRKILPLLKKVGLRVD